MTPAAQLVEHKIGRDLPDYLRSLQAQGLSLRQVAQRLSEEAGVSVSHETVRAWQARYVGRAA